MPFLPETDDEYVFDLEDATEFAESISVITLTMDNHTKLVGGFKAIRILGVHFNSFGCDVTYQIDSSKYLVGLVNKVQTLSYQWGVLDSDKYVLNDLGSEHLISMHPKFTQDRYDYAAPLILNLILQSFVGPMAFCGHLEFDVSVNSVKDFLISLFKRPPEITLDIIQFFKKTANIERNNMRYAMGATSAGYHEPLQNVQSGLSTLIGNFSSQYAYVDNSVFSSDNYSQTDYLSGQINERSTVAVNCSFGKESLFTYKFMEHFTGKAPHISIFQHITPEGKLEGQYQSTYLDKVFTDLNHQRSKDLRQIYICKSNFLKTLLEPICDVRLGAPICMLTHVFNQAQLINIYLNSPENVEIDYLLSGDEYERSICSEVELVSGTPKCMVHTYDYEQSPDMANEINHIYSKFKGYPQFGSIMYPITGYQAQMVLDQFFKYGQLQTSCHASHIHKGGNCGVCQKCLRIGTIKALVGDEANLDYKLTPEQIKNTLNWSTSDFFVTSMPADSDPFLAQLHQAFTLKFKRSFEQGTLSEEDQLKYSTQLHSMLSSVNNLPSHPSMLDVHGTSKLRKILAQAAALAVKK